MPTLDELFFLEPGQLEDTTETTTVNPFTEVDGLLDAQVLDVRYDGIRSVLGVILEMRLAERITLTSTSLLVVFGVSTFSWNQLDRGGGRTAWTIISSVPARTASGFSLEVKTSPNGSLFIAARSAHLYSVRIDGLEAAPPPSYVDQGISEIRSAVGTWASETKLISVARS